MSKQFKSLTQLAKAFKEGKISKRSKLTLSDDGNAVVAAVPTDKQGKPIKGAAAEVVFQSTSNQVLRDALKLAGIPVA